MATQGDNGQLPSWDQPTDPNDWFGSNQPPTTSAGQVTMNTPISVTPGQTTTATLAPPGNGWSGVQGGTPDAMVQSALARGLTGQAVADFVNQSYPGVVAYYPNFKGSGHDVFGLPSGYVTNEGGGWNYVSRGNEGGGNASLEALTGSGGPGTFAPNLAQFTPSAFTPAPFTAPTGVDETNDPGFQFRLDQGNKSYQNGAAAKGTLLTGGTLKGLVDYSQGAASAEYGNVFNRALATNQQNNSTGLASTQANNSSGLAANQNTFNQALQTHQTQYSDLFNLANLGYQATTSSYA